MRRTLTPLVLVLACAPALGQPSSVVNSRHNLSASGPGPVRAANESQVCIFCHAPHNAAPIRPLWNRATPVDAYTIYTSRSLDALPGQPTGTSKMCLSCHDGTIALGEVFSRPTPILMAGGVTTMPAGASNLGRILSDDHPISFRYDRSLSLRDPKIKDPSLLSPETRLDFNQELQCTTCHDAHDDSRGKFLVMRNDASQLCLTCHQMGSTTVTAHQDCAACHQPHSAPSGPYLLRGQNTTDTCVLCHNGTSPQTSDVGGDLHKISVHDTRSPVDPPDPAAEHTSCASCHEPHTMLAGPGTAPNIHPNFGTIGGIGASGGVVASATAEYEVCFKCHADTTTLGLLIPRKIVQPNKRLVFGPGAVSFHPVEAPGHNLNVPSLRPGWTVSSVMYCSTCHTSDSGRSTGGSGPNGTHGSNQQPLLAARYDTGDFTLESEQAYALCYTCHDRSNILSDSSFRLHKKHIVEIRTPCAACHDAHGIPSGQGNPTNNSSLINFATGIVTPNGNGRLEFRSKGMFSGECFLSCHGKDHSPGQY